MDEHRISSAIAFWNNLFLSVEGAEALVQALSAMLGDYYAIADNGGVSLPEGHSLAAVSHVDNLRIAVFENADIAEMGAQASIMAADQYKEMEARVARERARGALSMPTVASQN